MLGGHVRVERHGDYVVGGVASGGECAATLASLVDGGEVAHTLGDVLPFDGFQPHLGGRRGKNGWRIRMEREGTGREGDDVHMRRSRQEDNDEEKRQGG